LVGPSSPAYPQCTGRAETGAAAIGSSTGCSASLGFELQETRKTIASAGIAK